MAMAICLVSLRMSHMPGGRILRVSSGVIVPLLKVLVSHKWKVCLPHWSVVMWANGNVHEGENMSGKNKGTMTMENGNVCKLVVCSMMTKCDCGEAAYNKCCIQWMAEFGPIGHTQIRSRPQQITKCTYFLTSRSNEIQ